MVSQVIVRLFIVWGILNLILLPIEWRRWQKSKKSHHSWNFYVCHEMWMLTQIVLVIDSVFLVLSILGPIVYWILEPILS